MSANKFVRKQIYIDPKVQGSLVFRVVAYWIVCVLTIIVMLLCWRMVTSPASLPFSHFDDLWFQFGPALIASFILLPLVIYDIVSLSNRFTGPLFRLRRSMRALAKGEEVKPIRFRDGDFWQGLAEEFNAVVQRMQDIEESSKKDANKPSESASSDEAASEDESQEVTAKV